MPIAFPDAFLQHNPIVLCALARSEWRRAQVVRVSEGTPASLVFSEGIVYSCSRSSSRYEQSAYARKRTLLSGS
jgi:hypothetical protein